MKLCVDCKFYDGIGIYSCARKKRYVAVQDPVHGGTRQVNVGGFFLEPAGERASLLPWRCGPKGRHHEPKIPA